MEFTSYNSIENSYRQNIINMITINPELMAQKWYVTEKIHGANFSIIINRDGDISFAKRSGFIDDDEKFYGFDNNKEKFLEYARSVYDTLDLPDTVITIRGELYGGEYSHPEVPTTIDPRVQRGVEYTNANEFMAFDLEFDGHIVNQEEAGTIFNLAGIPYIPALFIGSFEDCLEYNNTFNSHIPAFHGHPELDVNICEGVVIKPNVASFFNNGKRVILKNKNEKFTEKSKLNKKSKVVIFSDEQNRVVEDMSQFINENRLRNVLSHFGEVKQKDFGKINGLLCQDVILDYLKEYDPLPDKKEWKLITKQASTSCAFLLRSNWLNILDGEY